MFIYVVEGPAGSGKSTLITKQHEDWPQTLVIEGRMSHTRNYEGATGLLEASMKDTRMVGALLTCGKELVLVDRWLISGLVYDFLRGEALMPDPGSFQHIMLGWLSMFVGFKHALTARGRACPPEVQINYMFNIPTANSVEFRRRATGKHYPFSAAKEVMAYRQVKSLLYNFLETSRFMIPPTIELDLQDVTEGEWDW